VMNSRRCGHAVRRPAGAFLLLLLSCLAACTGLPTQPAPAPADRISRVIAFGDDLSDGGAARALSQHLLAINYPEAFVLPTPPEAYPTGWWSNGPTAVMQLASLLGVPIDDYAIGGALTGRLLYDSAPGGLPLFDRWFPGGGGVLGQVDRYLASLRQTARQPDPRALHVLHAAYNDYLRWSIYRSPGTPFEVADQAVVNMGKAFDALQAAGARRILFVNATSAPILGGLHDNEPFDDYKRRFNAGLAALVERVAREHPETAVQLFDYYAVDRDLRAHASEHGITVLERPCQPVLAAPRPLPEPCSDPDRYYYWDEIHPSARAHALIGAEMRKLYP
jgi:cholinesterase